MIKILIFCEREASAEITNIALVKAKKFFMEEVADDGRMSGEELKQIRQDLHMTQEQFAEDVTSTTQSVISKMEKGLIKISPEIAEAALLAKELKINRR
jgi:DNA-binding transcriptional regulator YiaG